MNLGSKTAKVPQDTKKRGTVINKFQKPHDFSLQFKQNTLKYDNVPFEILNLSQDECQF